MKLPEVKILNKTLVPELEAVLAKHGLKLVQTSCTVDDLSGSIKYALKTQDTAAKDENGVQMTPYRAEWQRCAKAQFLGLYKLKAEWLDQPFPFNGLVYVVSGLKVGRGGVSAVKVTASREGKIYLFSPEEIALRMTKAVA